MKKSSVPFYTWSYYNLTAENLWNQVPKDPDMGTFHSNVQFWDVGKRILGGTETPWIGYEFEVGVRLNK